MIRSRVLPTRIQNLLVYLLVMASMPLLAIGLSCSGTERTVIVPPHVPNAEFVGNEECAECHSDKTESFMTATHSWIQGHGENALRVGCESCHGPGSEHVATGGAYATIVNPAGATIVNPRESPETCFQCHVDKQSEFRLPNRHPVQEGQVSCSDCHSPHEGPMVQGGDIGLASQNETCFQCHTAQRGPFVFEHEALRDGCTTCHSPHGSVNDKMLKARNANVCLQCHAQEQTELGTITIGERNHAGFLPRGTCWSAGCHEAVHGSHVSERLRY